MRRSRTKFSSTSSPMLRRVVGARIKDPHTRRGPGPGDVGPADVLLARASTRTSCPLCVGHGPARRGVVRRAERPRAQPLAPARGRRWTRSHPPTAVLRQEDQRVRQRGAGRAVRRRPGPPGGPRGPWRGHQHDGGRARLHPRRGRGPAESCPRQPAGGVPPGRRGRRAAHGSLPAGAAGAVQRRPAAPAGAGRPRPPARVHDVRPARRSALRTPRAAGRRRASYGCRCPGTPTS